METPICNFAREYAESNSLRLHMPGHKGTSFLGMEHLDITEINGADSLYEADGIIAQSEANASALFGCQTFYSAEGSSQCIRAMLYLVLLYAKQTGRHPLIAAGRNAHRAFLTAAALLDMDVDWLYPQNQTNYLSCDLTAEELDRYLKTVPMKPTAVYLTSPDYLGNMADIPALAAVCHKHRVLLAIDNAHGAYLRFLPQSAHPIDLGADLCCDSAHKTLPVLTGGAYLHINSSFPASIAAQVKNALALFGSASPSYLVLESLDAANLYLELYPNRLQEFLPLVDTLKEDLKLHGWQLYGQEPLKVTISARPGGYTGTELAEYLQALRIIPEFADPDHLVLMLTPETGAKGIQQLRQTLLQIPLRPSIPDAPPVFQPGSRALSIRQAMLASSERIPVSESLGRILAVPNVSCPPAVPILICGERIDSHAIECFTYYGITHCYVIRN